MDDREMRDIAPPPPPPEASSPDNVEEDNVVDDQHLEDIANTLVSIGQEVQENTFNPSPNPFLNHRKILVAAEQQDMFVDNDNNLCDRDASSNSATRVQGGDEEQQIEKTDTFDTIFLCDEEEEEGGISSQAIPSPPVVSVTEDDGLAVSASTGVESSLPMKVCNSIKYIYSVVLLLFCVTVVMAAIFSGQTNAVAEMNIPPVATFFIFWILIAWLGMIEGGQGCLVGLKPIAKSRYATSHPISFKVTALAHKADNMQRFIVGRQFVVVLIVFVTSLCGSTVSGAQVLGLPAIVNDIFVASGLSLILTTVVLGQLTAQVNAARCQLDFVNSYFMLFSTYVSLAIEWSGVLHSVYLVQRLFAKITGKSVESNAETPSTVWRKLFFCARVVFSLFVLGLAFAVTFAALFQGKTTAWANLPPYASVIVFFVLMGVAGALEGAQIALFAVVNLERDERLEDNKSMANKICLLVFKGSNLQAFLIGRQVFVTVCTFFIAKLITLNVVPGEDDNIFGVSDGLQVFFNTGLLGAVLTTIFSSLIWRVIASDFPFLFLNNPGAVLMVRLCLLLEATGVCASAWITARLQNAIARYQPDSIYLQASRSGTYIDSSKNSVDGGEDGSGGV